MDKGLICKIYKHFMQLNIKKNQLKDWQMIYIDISPKKTDKYSTNRGKDDPHH